MQLIEGPKDSETGSDEVPAQADSNGTLIALWLAGKAERTRRSYQDAARSDVADHEAERQ